MPKVAMVLGAIYKDDWKYARKLADRFYEESPVLAKLVDSKLKRCSF